MHPVPDIDGEKQRGWSPLMGRARGGGSPNGHDRIRQLFAAPPSTRSGPPGTVELFLGPKRFSLATQNFYRTDRSFEWTR